MDSNRLSLPEYPYPGLRPFRTNENAIFFGRRRQYVHMLNILERQHFLAVVGTSGCGKSSLIKAGLLPELGNPKLGFGDENREWVAVVARPGGGPFRNLAIELANASPDSSANVNPKDVETRLRTGTNGLTDTVYSIPGLASRNVLVVIDQFEEIFRFGDLTQRSISKLEGTHLHDDALAFVNTLLATVDAQLPQIYVAITMRSDSLGRCDQFPGLPEAITRSQFLPPRMTKDHLLNAIRRPLDLFNSTIEDAVVSDLLEAMGDRQDQLPIVQHALSQLWNIASENLAPGQPRHITTEHTRRCLSKLEGDKLQPRLSPSAPFLGTGITSMAIDADIAKTLASSVPPPTISTVSGTRDVSRLRWVTDAISTHADAVLASLATSPIGPRSAADFAERVRIARALFCALSQVDTNQEPERRLSNTSEVAGIVFGDQITAEQLAQTESVIQVFADEGHNFVFRSTTAEGNDALDVSHECLLRQWTKIQRWLEEEVASANEFKTLVYLARNWKHETERLIRPPLLDDAVAWRESQRPTRTWALRYDRDFAICMTFLDECVKWTAQNKDKQFSPVAYIPDKSSGAPNVLDYFDNFASWFARLVGSRLYTYDFFILYAWSDGRLYATALAKELENRAYTCFLDSEQYAKGDNWKLTGQRALKASQRILLIATPEAITSRAVQIELQYILSTSGRQQRIIPIVFDSFTHIRIDTLFQEAIGPDVLQIVEPTYSLRTGPSLATLDDISKTVNVTRVSQQRQRFLLATAMAFGVLAVFSFIFAAEAISQSRTSEARRKAAEDARSTAVEALNQQLEAYTYPTSICGEIAAISAGTERVTSDPKRDMLRELAKLSPTERAVLVTRTIQSDIAKLRQKIESWNPRDDASRRQIATAALSIARAYRDIWSEQTKKLTPDAQKLVASLLARPTFEKALDISKQLAQGQDSNANRQAFEQLYWGELVLFETPGIEQAMIRLRKAIQEKQPLKATAQQLDTAINQALIQLPKSDVKLGNETI